MSILCEFLIYDFFQSQKDLKGRTHLAHKVKDGDKVKSPDQMGSTTRMHVLEHLKKQEIKQASSGWEKAFTGPSGGV